MKQIVIACLLFVLLASVAFATPTVTSGTVTETKVVASGITRYSWDWKSDSSGNVTADLTNMRGQIQRVVCYHDKASSVPTTLYDVTLKDQDYVDVLAGKGANLTTATQTATSFACNAVGAAATDSVPVTVSGTLSLAITNAGASKGGVIRLYMKP